VFGIGQGSDSSISSNSSSISSSSDNSIYTSPSASRRPSFNGNGGMFHSLTNQKRNSADPDLMRRRQSWHEQEVGSGSKGIFARWWDGYVRGMESWSFGE